MEHYKKKKDKMKRYILRDHDLTQLFKELLKEREIEVELTCGTDSEIFMCRAIQ